MDKVAADAIAHAKERAYKKHQAELKALKVQAKKDAIARAKLKAEQERERLAKSNPSAAQNKKYGKKMNALKGWDRCWPSLLTLWNHESGWNERAENPSSGAYGIPQALPGSKLASAAPTGAPAPHPDRLGPRLHQGPLQGPVRRLVMVAGAQLVLAGIPAAAWHHGGMRTSRARQGNDTANGDGPAGGGSAGHGRQWARADATRQALLSAAQGVFADRGYADAGIAEIVERSGISVGSLYHHYGGKAGLYVALWEELTAEQEASAAQAVSAARKDGESDPIALFTVAARAYLRVCWERREAARLFLGGEARPGRR